MSLLRHIQDATTDPKFQLADILRMCKILAARLEHLVFNEWIEQELNGYEYEKQVPDYRIIKNLECQGDFFCSFGSGWKNCQIPLYPLPEDFRELVSTKDILQSVSALERVVSEANKSVLRLLWPADYLPLLNYYIGNESRYTCMEAWTLIPTHAYVAILDTVKSRILDFVIEIEAENPDAGDVELGTKPIPDQTITYILDRCIFHNNNQTTLSRATIQTHNEEICMSDKNVNNFQGTNSGNIANKVTDSARQQTNPYIHSKEEKTLTEAANEIQKLLKQLEQSNPNATEEEKIEYINDETTPSFKRRVINSLKATGEAAIDQFVLENKPLKVAKAAIKGWFQPDNSNNK
ncbi:MAG: hypothetical protein F6K40_22730 [Okeania sp. SIO3I5]|uniref:AbiTii domain-containing protein n=1 Tax=Okeania sp. SIO3I5 TaxID=2607805 RepID=UPI0013B6132D|nr:hypothetical protein [Okeania sp. SIO3I5]NEQ38934.1 hypothetical protein [Okeania sp. SIO3I5]